MLKFRIMQKQVLSVVPKGIVRNTPDKATPDGALLEAINMRFRDGGWRGTGDKTETGRYFEETDIIDKIYHHPVLPVNTYVVHNAVDNNVYITLFTDGNETQTATSILDLTTETFDRFSHIGNNLIVWCTANKYILYWKDTAYINISELPLPLVEVGDSDSTGQTITSAAYSSPTIPDYGFGATDNNKEFYRQAILGVYEKNRVTQLEAGYTHGLLQIRVAYKLFDGSVILHSTPIIHYAGFNSYQPTLTITGSDPYTAHLYSVNMAKVYLYYSFTEAQADLLVPFMQSGVVESIEVYGSKVYIPFDIHQTYDKWTYGGVPPETSDLADVYKTSVLFNIASLKLSDLLTEATTGTYTGDYDNISGSVWLKFKDNIVSEQLLPVDSFTHHKLLAESDYLYNSRLHAVDVDMILSNPLNNTYQQEMPVKQLSGTDFNGWLPSHILNPLLFSDFFGSYRLTAPITTSGLKIYQQVWVTADDGRKVITSELPTSIVEASSKASISTTIDIFSTGTSGTYTQDAGFDFDILLVDTLNSLNLTAHSFTAQSSGTFNFSAYLNIACIYGTVVLQRLVNASVVETYNLTSGTNNITDSFALTSGDVVTFNLQATSVAVPEGEEIQVYCYANSFVNIYLEGVEYTGYQAYSDGTNTALMIRSFVTYPDYRATKIRLFYTYGGNRYFLKDFNLTPCAEGNYAYNISAITADKFFPCTAVVIPSNLSAGNAMPSDDITTDDNSYTDSNRMQCSGIVNALYWDALNSYRFGSPENEIIAVQGVQQAMSDSAFGQYPLYIFSKSGIFTISHGTGEVLYSSIQPLNNEILLNRDAIKSISGSIVYATKEGLKIISGSSVVELSQPVEGSITNPLSSDVHFYDALTALNLPQINNYRSLTDFLTYLQTAKIFYDVQNKEIIVSNSSKSILTSTIIKTTTLNAGGSGYAQDDTFTINGGTTLATGKVLTVSAGAVATYEITTPGLGYAVANEIATTKTAGSGTGLKVNITALLTYSQNTYNYSYVYNLETKTWATITEVFDDEMTVSGRSIGIKSACSLAALQTDYTHKLTYLDTEDTTTSTVCKYMMFQTRPLNLGTILQKRIDRMVLRSLFDVTNGEYAVMLVYGSNDLVNWNVITYQQILEGGDVYLTRLMGNYKWFSVVFACEKLDAIIQLFDVVLQVRFSNLLK